MNTVLVTGANGFIGQILCSLLRQQGYLIKAVTRKFVFDQEMIEPVIIPDISAETDWTLALNGVDVVIHLAARVHVMRETSSDALQAFRQVNSFGTENLAKQAAEHGVKRFIYISSIKVLGEGNGAKLFMQNSLAAPEDPYAISKWEAEQRLQAICQVSAMEWVIIRPPLVYGPDVKGNFLRLLRLVKKGLPIPLGSVNNRRSLVYVENLCDLIVVCITHLQATGKILLVTDSESYSTAQLINLLGNALQVKVYIWPFPLKLLQCIAKIIGKQAEIGRLCDSLEIDDSETKCLLSWQPPYSVEQGLAKTVASFLS